MFTREGTLTRVIQSHSKQLFYAVKVGLLAVVYFSAARAGLSLSPVSGFATLVWPPTGIALVALFIFGWRLWPAIFIGATLVNFITGAPLLVALGIGLGNTLEPVVGVYLLKRFGFQSPLARVRDVVLLVSYAALFSTLISATIGTSSLLIGGTITAAAYPRTWIAWWIGDMLGDLIVAPLLLVWASSRDVRLNFRHLAEAFVLTGLFVVLGAIIFENYFSKTSTLRSAPYLMFALLIWAVLRFRSRLVITLNFGLAAFTVLAAIRGYGPFVGKTLNERLYSSQLFIGITAITFLSFSAVMSEHRRDRTVTHKLNQRLKKVLAQKTAELRKEREIEKLKDEFIAVASHELKTPITSIKAYAGILDEKLKGSKDTKAADIAARIDKQADKLTRFVEELLDVSLIESGNLVLYKSKFDMATLIKGIIDDFQLTAQNHQIIIEIVKLPRVTADQNRLEQVLLNLLTNAVKYSAKADQVIVSGSATPDEVTISIQDFGPGISKKNLSRIFGRFYRTADGNKRQQAVSGIGLGLYIASEIIKQHGGKLWVESRPGKGSTFSFSVPLK